MVLKKLTLTAVILAGMFAAGNSSFGQNNGGIKITLPDFPIVIGSEYDKEGYDYQGYNREGYDRNGYDRYGYDRYGYDRYGYDRSGYDRNGYNRSGYDRYGNRRESCGKKKHSDNGNHYGWYKSKHKKSKKHDKDDDDD